MKKIRNDVHGWINLDKPMNYSSAKAVAIVKRIFNAKKVGHGGTLDPLASGILPIALGEATKTMQFITDSEKAYRFTIKFGAATSTDDAEGELIEKSDEIPSEQEIVEILPEFTGEIEQAPPIYSAIKIDGKRAYKLARSGEDFEIKKRKIMIFDLKFLGFKNEFEAEFETTCGKGTYIRSLGRDLAKKLNSCGHITELRRIKVGTFNEANSISLNEIEKTLQNQLDSDKQRPNFLMQVEQVLDDILVLDINQLQSERLKTGLPVSPIIGGKQGETACAMLGDKLIAIGRFDENLFRPIRVFNH